jgi:hypothetical protein
MGSVTINGSTSGSVTIAAPAVAGTTTLTLPATTSNVLTSVTSVAAVTGTPSASNYLRGDGTWAAVSASGQLIRAPRVLTSGTSYTTPAGCNNVLIEMIGAGGGGGGCGYNGAAAYGGGGGAAPYASVYVAVTPNTTYTYAIGSGGTGGVNPSPAATAGGTTSITIGATTYSITGGGAGALAYPGTGASGAAGTATNFSVTIATVAAVTPRGGSTQTPTSLNMGGNYNLASTQINSDALRSVGWGAGGGGAMAATSGFQQGSAGYQGVIMISEYT